MDVLGTVVRCNNTYLVTRAYLTYGQVLVFYTFPYLGIIFAPLGVIYYTVALYYRRTSVETKRLDSLMRSALYASYTGKVSCKSICCLTQTFSTETLTGLATVRAYKSQVRVLQER